MEPIVGIIIITMAAVYIALLPGKSYLLSTYAVAEHENRLRKVQPKVRMILFKYIIGIVMPSSIVSEKLSPQFINVHLDGQPLTLLRKSVCVLNEFKRHQRNGKSKV